MAIILTYETRQRWMIKGLFGFHFLKQLLKLNFENIRNTILVFYLFFIFFEKKNYYLCFSYSPYFLGLKKKKNSSQNRNEALRFCFWDVQDWWNLPE